MSKQYIEPFNGFTLYTSHIGKEQLFITASVNDDTKNCHSLCESIYQTITQKIQNTGMQIVLERMFGCLNEAGPLIQARASGIKKSGGVLHEPFTYIQGRPIGNTGLAGIQMRAVRPSLPEKIWPIIHENTIYGHGWKRNGTVYLLLQDIHGSLPHSNNTRKSQAIHMFEKASDILKEQNATYRNVVRTWIYLSDILDWYGMFNDARNEKYEEFGLIRDPQKDRSDAEKIYLPASTGIQGDNPSGAAGTMDVLAIIQGEDACSEIVPITGKKQNSAFRYGSAFSRAMAVREIDATQILVSGTASIDEDGRTMFQGDTRAQILKTIEVVDALISQEGAALKDISKATVFLKNINDYEVYLKAIDECGLPDFPAVVVQADICRSDLLFELDAVAALDIG
ncbi:hypothetical protein JW835_05505 [bacterium]|nr:hypothetical protein [bacterium]